MESNILEKASGITSFLELKSLFEESEAKGAVEENRKDILVAYVSLISSASIIRRNKDLAEELKAAQWCYDFAMACNPGFLNEPHRPDSLDVIYESIVAQPPLHTLLQKCESFYELNKLLTTCPALFSSDLVNYEGDHFCVAWRTLIEKGFHGELTDENVASNNSYISNSLLHIGSMKLNEENRAYISSLNNSGSKAFLNLLNKYYGIGQAPRFGNLFLIIILILILLYIVVKYVQ